MRILSLAMLLFSFSTLAQTGPINIHLKSGRVISTQYAYLHSGYNSYLRIHEKKGEKIPINQIDHVEGTDEKGNYRYFKPVLRDTEVWAERSFTSSRIEIYHTDILTGTMTAEQRPKGSLYSKDGGSLQPLKLKNLKKDLGDCTASMEYLKKGKKISTTQTVIYVASYSLILAGIVSFANDASDVSPSDPETSGPSIPPTIIIGAVGAWIPFIMGNAKREKFLEALKAYE